MQVELVNNTRRPYPDLHETSPLYYCTLTLSLHPVPSPFPGKSPSIQPSKSKYLYINVLHLCTASYYYTISVHASQELTNFISLTITKPQFSHAHLHSFFRRRMAVISKPSGLQEFQKELEAKFAEINQICASSPSLSFTHFRQVLERLVRSVGNELLILTNILRIMSTPTPLQDKINDMYRELATLFIELSNTKLKPAKKIISKLCYSRNYCSVPIYAKSLTHKQSALLLITDNMQINPYFRTRKRKTTNHPTEPSST